MCCKSSQASVVSLNNISKWHATVGKCGSKCVNIALLTPEIWMYFKVWSSDSEMPACYCACYQHGIYLENVQLGKWILSLCACFSWHWVMVISEVESHPGAVKLYGAMSALAGRYAGQVCRKLKRSSFFMLQYCVLLRCLCASSK